MACSVFKEIFKRGADKMNIVFVGGGSFRTLPIVRAVLSEGNILRGGSIRLVDFNIERAETVGRFIMRCPEFAGSGCTVSWTDKIGMALPGADLVSVSFPVGSLKTCLLSERASWKHGFFGSDQLSVSGAFRSVTGGVVLHDIARKMEKHCPRAWLVDFANPVSVYSGLVNNHTKVRALGICAGFSNHRWDLSRILFDKDDCCNEFKVSAAGVNHCSILLRGTFRGKDIYGLLDRKIGVERWKPCRIPKMPRAEKSIRYGLSKLAEMRRRFGTILFSTEQDGLMTVFSDEKTPWEMSGPPGTSTPAGLNRYMKEKAESRKRTDAEFRSYLDKDMDDSFWQKSPLENPYFASNPSDVTVPIIRALGGTSREWIVASLPNNGAVKGFKDRTVLEYSLHLDKDGVHPEPDLEIPDCFHGLMSSLASHQTLLGDAIATLDPKLFSDALFAYPIHQNTKAAKTLWRDLLRIHGNEMPAVFQKAKDYF